MAYWRPGQPRPASQSSFLPDGDGEEERDQVHPVFNPLDGLPLQQQRQRLPIHKHRLSLLYAVETHSVAVVSGATGCGKSTQLPQYLDEAGWTSHCYRVAVTLPRRIAAMALAKRVAQEMGVLLGEDVGYKVRFERNVTPGKTRLEFMTEGVLLREMLEDPLLTRYGVIMVDEAHERSLQGDLLLSLLKKVLRKRPQLRLLLASATADVEAFLRFFRRSAQSPAPVPERKRPRCGWDDETGEFHRQREEDADWRKLCQELGEGGAPPHDVCLTRVEGRSHPVTVHYLDEPAADYVQVAAETTIAIHLLEPQGDILVFLTGQGEVEATCALIRERLHQERERGPKRHVPPLNVFPLCGTLSQAAQLKALAPALHGGRKAIISTNIAEASVTVEGVAYVVDAGLAKLNAFCPHNGVRYLNVAPCSRSSMRQRAGRAGRLRPGHCFRLLTKAAFSSTLVPEHTLPELVRADLAEPVLLLKCMGIDDVGSFEFVTAPTRAALELALEELYALGALDSQACVVEPLGPRMAHGPLPPALMRLLLLSAEAPHACASEAVAACSILSLPPPRLPPNCATREGDVVALVNAFRLRELDGHVLEHAARVQRSLEGYLRRFQLPIESCDDDVTRFQRALCGALFLNAARRLSSGSYRLCRPIDEVRAPHVNLQLQPGSVLASLNEGADHVVAVELRGGGEQAWLVNSTAIQPEWLPELAPHYFCKVPAERALKDEPLR